MDSGVGPRETFSKAGNERSERHRVYWPLSWLIHVANSSPRYAFLVPVPTNQPSSCLLALSASQPAYGKRARSKRQRVDVVGVDDDTSRKEEDKRRERERELRGQVDWARGKGNYLSPTTGCSLHICLAEPGAVVPLRRVWARLRILIHDLACLVFMLCCAVSRSFALAALSMHDNSKVHFVSILGLASSASLNCFPAD